MTSEELCQAAGITYRQCDYWTRTGILKPDQEAAGSGSSRNFTDTEARVARRIRRLLDAGFVLETAAKIARLAEAMSTAEGYAQFELAPGVTLHIQSENVGPGRG